MYFLYILKSKKLKRFYIGYTDDLKRRLEYHNSGKVFATKLYTPWKVVYYEAYSTEGEARRREHNLKLRANAWNQLKARIRPSLNTD